MIGAQLGGLGGEVQPMRGNSTHHRQSAPRHLRQGQAFLQNIGVVLDPKHQGLQMRQRCDQLTGLQHMSGLKAQIGHFGLLRGIGLTGRVYPRDADGGTGGCAHGGVVLTYDTSRQATAVPERQSLAEFSNLLF